MQDLHHGKEIYNFFGRFEIYGILGLLVSSIIFAYLTYKILIIVTHNDIESYNDFLIFILKNNKYKEKIYEITKLIINMFLLASFYIMIAGLSSYFKQKYNISSYLTSIIGVFFCYSVLNKNIKGVIKISTICVPIIIIFIIIIGIKNFEHGIYEINNMNIEINLNSISLINSSSINALLYAGYNSILLIPVIISLKKYCNKKNITIISYLIGLIIFLLGLCVYVILLKGNDYIMQMDMPIAYIIKKIDKNHTFFYGIVIIISILTSIISAGYSFLKNSSKNKKEYQKYLKLICISSILISNIGFSKLINLLYPTFGLFGIIQIYFIFIRNTE